MSHIKNAIIPAAGNNKRLETLKLTRILPKTMIPIIGKPILEYIIGFLAYNNVQNIYIIVNNKKETIINYFGNGSDFGVNIKYIVQEHVNGIAMAINLTKDLMSGDFICILGDTFIRKQRIDNMIKKFYDENAVVVQALSLEQDESKIRQSCNVVVSNDDRIVNIVEKPKQTQTNIRGSGIYVFNQEIFDFISKTKKTSVRNEVEITDTIRLIAESNKAYGSWLQFNDININVEKDIELATIIALEHEGDRQ